METKPKFHKSGCISYSSLNGHCKIKMNQNRFLFWVEFLQLLPDKTPDWVQNENENINGNRLMKLCYKYATIKQYYSINQFPEIFSLPIAIMWKAIQERYNCESVPPKINNDFELPLFANNTTDGPECGSFAKESKYFRECTKEEYSTKLPETNRSAISDYIKEQSSQHKSFENYKKSQLSTSEGQSMSMTKIVTPKNETGVWEDDEVSPACHSYNYNKANVTLIWAKNATFRRISDEVIEVFIHQDKSILICREYGKYFNHYQTNDTEKGQLRAFTATSIPLTAMSASGHYSIKDIVEQCYEMYRNTIEEHKSTSDSEVENEEQAWLYAVSENTEKDIIDRQVSEGWGKFIAYRNGAVEIKFEDRTHLRMMKDSPFVKIITFLGTELKFRFDQPLEFTKFVTTEERESLNTYIRTAKEYIDWAYMTPVDRYMKEKSEQVAMHRLKSLQEDYEHLYNKNSNN